jgi:hypothetical protein
MIRPFVAAFAALSLASCGSEEAPPAEETALPEFPAPTTTATGASQIPTAMQGRWGLVPEDCTSTRGDNKGLIVVDAASIKFYESRATIQEVKETTETRLLATFGFTGEGQEWTVDEELVLTSEGTLIRTEHGEGAMAGALTYAPCE